MPPTTTNKDLPYETRLDSALQAIETLENPKIQQISYLYNIPRTTLRDQLRGRVSRHDAQLCNRKLTPTKDQLLLQRIIALDEQGLSPTLPFI